MSDEKKKVGNSTDDLGNFSISSRGMAKDIIKRFMRNKTAVVGLVIIVVLAICALFPGRYQIQIMKPFIWTMHLQLRPQSIFWERTNWDGICLPELSGDAALP